MYLSMLTIDSTAVSGGGVPHQAQFIQRWLKTESYGFGVQRGRLDRG